MGFLGYIAGTLVAPNLAGFLINKGLTSLEEKKVIKMVEEKIVSFNQNYNDTEVDSKFFADFLEQEEVVNSIFENIFNAYSSNINESNFSKVYATEAIEFVNNKKDKFKHTQVKDTQVFENYFEELHINLKQLRESLLTVKDKVVVSLIDESVKRTGNDILSFIEQKSGNDYIIKERIERIISLIDQGLYDEALKEIGKIFESGGQISNEQRVELYYQKARILIATENIKELDELRSLIQHYNKNSKYIYEIDYWKYFHQDNEELLKNSISQLESKGIENSKISLMKTNYYLKKGEFDKVLEILYTDGQMNPIFHNEDRAFGHIGYIYMLKNDFDNAIKCYERALELRYKIEYFYHLTVCKSLRILGLLNRDYDIVKELKNEIENYCNDLDSNYFFIKNSDAELRIQHWSCYLTLAGAINSELALQKIEKIEPDIINSEQIKCAISEIYFFNNQFEQAHLYLKDIWRKDSILYMRYLYCCKQIEGWEYIEESFQEEIINLLDNKGIIISYKLLSLERNGLIESAKELVIENLPVYKNHFFYRLSLQFFHKNKFEDEYINLLRQINDLPEPDVIDEIIELAKLLYSLQEFDLLREVVKNLLFENEVALELYLNSYGEVDPSNEKFSELILTVEDLYSKGNKTKILLITKFYIELSIEKYLIAFDSLDEYRRIYSNDLFYNLNIIQCVTFGSLDYDASQEVNYVLSSHILKQHIVAAQYYAYKGNWEECKSILRNAFYKYDSQIGEEEISGFLKVHFNNVYRKGDIVELPRISDNSMSVLEDDLGNKIQVIIHSNDNFINQNREYKFDSINLKGTSDEAYILKAIGQKNELLKFDGKEYKVVDIINLDVYLFRYFLKKIQEEFPGNNVVIPITGNTVEELANEFADFMKLSNENITNNLDIYNFGVETGAPITFLSEKNVNRYLETVQFLINGETQSFYATYSDELPQKASKYVLTISSIVILNELGLLEKLLNISEEIYITSSTKLFIRNGVSESIKYDAVASTAYLDENKNLMFHKATDEIKIAKRRFWTDILTIVNQFSEVKVNKIESDIYNELHSIVDISEFESINLAKQEGYILICEDLFITRISKIISPESSVSNCINFLYHEKLIDINELIVLVKDLTKKRYLNCVNYDLLYEMYNYLLKQIIQDENGVEQLLQDMGIIFKNLFSEVSEGVNSELYQSFIDLVNSKNTINSILYTLLEKPMKLKPYKEFIHDLWFGEEIEFGVEE